MLAGVKLDEVAGHERVASIARRRPSRTTNARGTSSWSSAAIARRARSSVTKPITVLIAEHGGDGGRFDRFAQQRGNHSRGQEQCHDDAAQLIRQDGQGRHGPCGRESIRAVSMQPPPRFVVREPVPAARELREQRPDGRGM